MTPIGVIIDSTYSRHHSVKSALEWSNQVKLQKTTLPEKNTIFRCALSTKTYNMGNFKGVSLL